MNLSRAVAVAADSLAMQKEQLRSIAQTLESAPRRPPRRPRSGIPSANRDPDTQWRHDSTVALQASRRLLARTIDMLT